MTRRSRRTEILPSSCPPAWLWLLAGIFIGIFLSFLFYLKQLMPETAALQATTQTTTAKQADAATTDTPNTLNQASATAELPLPPPEQTKPSTPAPRFEFYDMLPKPQSTPPPERSPTAAEQARIQAQDPTATREAAPLRPEDFPVAIEPYHPAVIAAPPADRYSPAAAGSFMLQVASFRDQRAANDLQMELQQQGFSSSIQQALVQGQQWYRVKLGPYASQIQAQQTQRLLQQQGHQPIVQKLN